MSYEKPTIGRIVHYKLNSGDVSFIGGDLRGGHHNPVRDGDVYPAMVVRVFDPSTTTANLQVFLDGDCSYWATSRTEGTDPGHWSWPGRTPLVAPGA